MLLLDVRFTYCGTLVGLPSFPTRRSSDLTPHVDDPRDHGRRSGNPGRLEPRHDLADSLRLGGAHEAAHPEQRSEEHTSELQSHHDLVCRLLLEKKTKEPPRTPSCTRPAFR